jgi:hypothetical protein
VRGTIAESPAGESKPYGHMEIIMDLTTCSNGAPIAVVRVPEEFMGHYVELGGDPMKDGIIGTSLPVASKMSRARGLDEQAVFDLSRRRSFDVHQRRTWQASSSKWGLPLTALLEMEGFAYLSITKSSPLGGSRPSGTFYSESLAVVRRSLFDEWCIGALNFYSPAEQFESLREILILIAGRADDHLSNRKLTV